MGAVCPQTSNRMAEKTIPQSKTPRAHRTALDRLDWGQPLQAGESLRQKISLPEGVTSRELYSDIVGIAWPSLVELLLTQLTSMADLIMVGQLGPWAISSVGLTTQPKFLLSTMFTALNVGCMTMVARHKGAGRQDKAQLILRQSLMINLVLSVFFAVLGFAFAHPLVLFMGAQDEQTLLGGMQYLQIQMLGLPFLALTTTITNALRGAGDSKTALFYNTIANVVNIFLNYLFIYGRMGMPRLEVAGASLATSISQGVAMAIALAAVLNRNQYVHLNLRAGFRPDRESIADMIVYAKTVASLGTVMLACHQVCMNILSLTFMTGQAFAVSATSLVGQSLGKLRADMAVLYSRRTQVLGTAVSVVLMVVLFFFGWLLFAVTGLSNVGEWFCAMFGAYGWLGTSTLWELQSWSYVSLVPIFIVGSLPWAPWLRKKIQAWAEGDPHRAIVAAPQKGNTAVPPCQVVCEGPVPAGRARAVTAVNVLADVALLAVFVLSCMSVVSSSYNPFIYFQF